MVAAQVLCHCGAGAGELGHLQDKNGGGQGRCYAVCHSRDAQCGADSAGYGPSWVPFLQAVLKILEETIQGEGCRRWQVVLPGVLSTAGILLMALTAEMDSFSGLFPSMRAVVIANTA